MEWIYLVHDKENLEELANTVLKFRIFNELTNAYLLKQNTAEWSLFGCLATYLVS
jgi:hypothetical protein